jgi:hypothetical protein
MTGARSSPRGRVGSGALVISGGSGVLLQQGEATGEVRGEHNQSGRLRRRCSLRWGGDSGSKFSSVDGRRWTGCRGGAMCMCLGGALPAKEGNSEKGAR